LQDYFSQSNPSVEIITKSLIESQGN
jgi:hypothetical protein